MKIQLKLNEDERYVVMVDGEEVSNNTRFDSVYICPTGLSAFLGVMYGALLTNFINTSTYIKYVEFFLRVKRPHRKGFRKITLRSAVGRFGISPSLLHLLRHLDIGLDKTIWVKYGKTGE